VIATIEQLRRPKASQSQNIHAIVDRVRPAVETVLALDRRQDPERLVSSAVRANVRFSAHQLRHGSALLEKMIANDGLLVVGAEYSLETGEVEFFDGMPEET
jgi:carbonic anhydrase